MIITLWTYSINKPHACLFATPYNGQGCSRENLSHNIIYYVPLANSAFRELSFGMLSFTNTSARVCIEGTPYNNSTADLYHR